MLVNAPGEETSAGTGLHVLTRGQPGFNGWPNWGTSGRETYFLSTEITGHGVIATEIGGAARPLSAPPRFKS